MQSLKASTRISNFWQENRVVLTISANLAVGTAVVGYLLLYRIEKTLSLVERMVTAYRCGGGCSCGRTIAPY
jgi:hypothetical protein